MLREQYLGTMRALIAAALIAASWTASAEDWRGADTALLTATLGTLAVDWAQTRYIARHSDDGCTGKELHICTPRRTHSERNPILGKHPSVGDVDKYFTAAMIGTAAVATYLPRTPRRLFLGATLTLELAAIHRNYAAGVRLDF